MKKFNPENFYDPPGSWVNAVELGGDERLLVTSGVVGITPTGELVEDPEDQIREAWKNVGRMLESAGMSPDDLVKMTVYMTSTNHLPISREAREQMLGEARCAMTGVVVQLVDPAMVIEIDVYAAKR